MSRQKKLINKTNYPQHAIEKFARCVYPDIVAFYQSEEGQREFAEWQAEQAAKKAQRKLHTTKKEVTAAVTSVVILWAFSSVGLLAWKWEECGSRWGSRLARIARNKQIIRTRPRLGRTGSDYIALVRATGLEPARFWQWNLNPPSLPIPPCPRIPILSRPPGLVNGGKWDAPGGERPVFVTSAASRPARRPAAAPDRTGNSPPGSPRPAPPGRNARAGSPWGRRYRTWRTCSTLPLRRSR